MQSFLLFMSNNMENIDFSDLISQKEAAEIRGVSRAAINELVKRGRLSVQEIGGKKFLSRMEVESFEGQQGKKLKNLTQTKKIPKISKKLEIKAKKKQIQEETPDLLLLKEKE